jgi:nitrogen fixation protein NifU and related proteins
MSELRELYQQIILDHNKAPRNFGRLANANRDSEGYNPLCGDHLHVFIDLDGSTIRQISFEGSGCAISRASASLMTAALKGKTVDEAEAVFADFHQMLLAATDAPVDRDRLGKLAALAGVREFPMRVKCATLPWHTARAALAGHGPQVTTE